MSFCFVQENWKFVPSAALTSKAYSAPVSSVRANGHILPRRAGPACSFFKTGAKRVFVQALFRTQDLSLREQHNDHQDNNEAIEPINFIPFLYSFSRESPWFWEASRISYSHWSFLFSCPFFIFVFSLNTWTFFKFDEIFSNSVNFF